MFDIFGLDMRWTVGGNLKFKTPVGLFLTFVFLVLVLIYSIPSFIDLYKMQDPYIEDTVTKINLADESKNYNMTLSPHDFRIGFGLNGGSLLPSNIGSFEVYYRQNR